MECLNCGYNSIRYYYSYELCQPTNNIVILTNNGTVVDSYRTYDIHVNTALYIIKERPRHLSSFEMIYKIKLKEEEKEMCANDYLKVNGWKFICDEDGIMVSIL